ncbi:MAG: DNA-binding protein [Bacteroidia bacterium]|nr:DNA-binding protein [Bacteroidia bacterium]
MFDDRIALMNAQTEQEHLASSAACTVEKKTYTVMEIQDILGISQPTAYALIKQNLFHSIKVGRHIRISKSSFDSWVDGQ